MQGQECNPTPIAGQIISKSCRVFHQKFRTFLRLATDCVKYNGPRQANLLLIAYASSEGSGEPAHPRSLARTSAARSYKQ